MAPNTKSSTVTAQDDEAVVEERNRRAYESLLFHRVLEIQGIPHHALARIDSRNDLLHAVGKHVSSDHCHPSELTVLFRYVHQSRS